MAKMNSQDLSTLRYLANLAYLGFKRAAKTQHALEYRGAACLYDALGECLAEALGPVAYMNWQRERGMTEEALRENPELDGIIVQCLVGKMGTSQLFAQRKSKSPARGISNDEARKALMTLCNRTVDYHAVAWNATVLANAGREDLLLEALTTAGIST
ncbi:MAG: hypothetical protein HYZ53_04620 [Planctomycetes bacterium]|nr:hypothetical protein [Planctomycetota bacterium]